MTHSDDKRVNAPDTPLNKTDVVQTTIESNDTDSEPVFSIKQKLFSVISAFFGVQNQHNHKRDFKRGSFGEFIFLGVVLVLSLILIVMLLVSTIIDASKTAFL